MTAAEISSYFLDEPLPDGIDLLSVNFPVELTKDTRISITSLAQLSLISKIYVRDDPRGRPYYWIWGEKLREFPVGTDAYETVVKGNISVTPISLRGLSISKTEAIQFNSFKEYIDDILKKTL